MILKLQYPNRESKKEILIASSIVGLLLYVFLILYQPFGTHELKSSYKYLLLFPYAIITSFSFCTVNLALRHQKLKWTIGSELLKTLWIFLLISTCSYFYNTLFLSKVHLSFENYLYMCAYTVALGFPVAVIYLLARYIYHHQYHPAGASIESNEKLVHKTDQATVDNGGSATLCIAADYGNLTIKIKEEDFIYATSADNYCVLHFYDNGMLKQEMIRISLTRLLNQIQTDAIKQVHRSCIVNLKKVNRFKGNASGYQLSMDNMEIELSLSRNYIQSVIPVLKNFAVRP